MVRVPAVETLDQAPCPPAGGHLGRGAACEGIEHECAKEVWERGSEACMRGEDFQEHRLAGKADDDAALTIDDLGVRAVIR